MSSAPEPAEPVEEIRVGVARLPGRSGAALVLLARSGILLVQIPFDVRAARALSAALRGWRPNAGSSAGEPIYVAPELADGERPFPATCRTLAVFHSTAEPHGQPVLVIRGERGGEPDGIVAYVSIRAEAGPEVAELIETARREVESGIVTPGAPPVGAVTARH